MTLLPPALADRALGYAAIFMLFWYGLHLLVGGRGGGWELARLAGVARRENKPWGPCFL